MTANEVIEKICTFEEHSENSTNMRIGTMGQIIDYYLKSDVEICPYSGMLGFCLDDRDAFVECITSLDSEKMHIRLLSIFNYLVDKFGEWCDIEKRYSFYNYFDWDIDPISIKAFYKENMAACTERGSFVHNVFKILGYDSKLVIGHLLRKDIKEGHCYNLITGSKGKCILFDTSCFIDICRLDSGKISEIYSYPVIAKLSEQEYSNILNGKGYNLNKKNLVFPEGFEILIDEDRVYY